MKILILDNNIDMEDHGAKDLTRYSGIFPEGTFYVRRPPDGDLPSNPAAYDKLIISGSKTSATDTHAWVDHLCEFIRNWIDAGKPLLGICFGHQCIARALGGVDQVHKSKTPEFGWTKIEQDEASPLFEGLPKSYYSFSSHHDEVIKVPHGFKKTVHSDKCAIQGIDHVSKPIFGLQFHPEKDLSGMDRVMAYLKAKKEEKLFDTYAQSAKLYNDKIGPTIFLNFLNL